MLLYISSKGIGNFRRIILMVVAGDGDSDGADGADGGDGSVMVLVMVVMVLVMVVMITV